MSNSNEQIIRSFYDAFSKKDAEAMASIYSDDIEFSDPVFPHLSGEQARNMWRMLCRKSKDLKVIAKDITANESNGTATWEAWYTFGATGRKVHNIVQATFELRNGRIIRHTDRFNFWKWSSQALGPIGVMLGWSPFLLAKVRKTAQGTLKSFQSFAILC